MLRDLQLDFARALADGDAAARGRLVAKLRPLPNVSVRSGLDIYASALERAPRTALAEIFPVCVRLVGERCFDELARRFAAGRPSRHPDLGRVGEPFAAFVSDEPLVADVPYLASVARLEWARHQAREVGEPRQVPDPEAVGRAIEAAPEAHRFELHPSVSPIESEYAVHAIWSAHQEPEASVTWPEARADAPDRLVVWRGPVAIEIERVADPLFDLLTGIAAGQSVAELIEGAMRRGPSPAAAEQAFLATLQHAFSRGWVTGVISFSGPEPLGAPDPQSSTTTREEKRT